MKKILITAGILNFLTILFLGYDINNRFFFFSFLLFSGIAYIYIANNNNFEYKRKMLTVLGIFNIIPNFISGLLVLISLDKKFDTNIKLAVNKEKLDPEIRKIDMLLKLGVAMVIVSGLIFATTSWNEVSGIFKFLFLIFFSAIFYGLYFFLELKLKIKQSAFVYFILANLFLVFSFLSIGYFALVGSWFSIIGEGSKIFLASLSVFIGLVSILINSIYPKELYKYILSSTLVISLFLVLDYFAISLEIILFIILSISSFILLIKISFNKKCNLIQTFNKLVIYLIAFLFIYMYSEFTNVYVILSLGSLLIYDLFCLVSKTQTKFLSFIIAGFLLLIPLTSLSNIIEDFQMASVVLGGVVSSLYILNLWLYSTPKKEFYLNILISFSNTLLLLIFLSLINQNFVIEALIVSLMLFSTYGLYIFLNKYDKVNLVEKRFKLIKIATVIYSVFRIINYYTLEIDVLWILLITTIVFLGIYLLNKKHKKEHYVAFVSLLIISSLVGIFSINPYILGILFVLSSAPFLIKFNSPKSLKNLIPSFIYFLMMTYLIFISSEAFNFDVSRLSLLVVIIYITLAILLKKNKTLSHIAQFSLIFPLQSLIYNINIDSQIKIIIQMSFHFYLIFILCNQVIKDVKLKNIIATMLVSLISISSMFNGELLVGLYIGLVALLFIVIGYIRKDYSYLFITGIGITIVNIIYQLSMLTIKIPLWAYLLFSGLGLIIFVTYKEIKRSKK